MIQGQAMNFQGIRKLNFSYPISGIEPSYAFVECLTLILFKISISIIGIDPCELVAESWQKEFP